VSKENVIQTLHGGPRRGIAELGWHGCMDAFNSSSEHQHMERGDVTKANNPLGVFFELGKVKQVHDAGRAVASARAEYCFDPAAVQSLLQVDQTFFVGSRKVAVALAHDVVTDGHLEVPFFKDANGPGQYIPGDLAGGRYQRHAVATFQVSGYDHMGQEKTP